MTRDAAGARAAFASGIVFSTVLQYIEYPAVKRATRGVCDEARAVQYRLHSVYFEYYSCSYYCTVLCSLLYVQGWGQIEV